jgi:hypothetical protein
MRSKDRIRSLLLVLALVCLTAAQASAASFYSLDLIGGDELGLVRPGQPLEYQHTFTPDHPGSVRILSAELGVTFADASSCNEGRASQRRRCELRDLLFEPEYAVVRTDGQLLGHSDLTPPWVAGNVTALIHGAGDSIDVTISSLAGDFRARSSWLLVHYEIRAGQQPGNPIPEPSAALLFASGLLVSLRFLRKP